MSYRSFCPPFLTALSIDCGDTISAGRTGEEGTTIPWLATAISLPLSICEPPLSSRGRRCLPFVGWCSESLDSTCCVEATRARCMKAAPVLVARRAGAVRVGV